MKLVVEGKMAEELAERIKVFSEVRDGRFQRVMDGLEITDQENIDFNRACFGLANGFSHFAKVVE